MGVFEHPISKSDLNMVEDILCVALHEAEKRPEAEKKLIFEACKATQAAIMGWTGPDD